jgi:hypothetical protein
MNNASQPYSRSHSQQRALWFALGWTGYKPVEWILAKVRKRWPVASAGAEFEQRLRAVVEREEREIAEWEEARRRKLAAMERQEARDREPGPCHTGSPKQPKP